MWNIKHARSRGLTALVCLVGGLVTPVVAADAANATGQTPGSYVNASFDAPVAGFTQTQRLDVSPGDANVYWSTQFGLTKSAGGYIGMQRWKNGSGQFLMSIWDSTGGRPGPDAKCITFEEDGSGSSCRIEGIRPEAGHTYRTRLTVAPDGWITGGIDDLTSGERHLLGSVKTPAGGRVSKDIGSWTEYFDWNSDEARCEDEAFSSMTVSTPVGADGVQATRTSTSTSTTCAAGTRLVERATDTVQQNGLGNSAGGHVVASDGACLDLQGGTGNGALVDVWTSCHQGTNQNWVHAADGSLRTQYRCLDANGSSVGSAVTIWSCTGGTNQQWETTADGRLRGAQSGACLSSSSVPGSPTAAGLTLQPCASATRWTLPETTEPADPPVLTGAPIRDGGRCLDLLDHATWAGAPVGSWSCTGGDNQRWGNGPRGELTALDLCLDANGTTPGSPVNAWTCNGGDNQHWSWDADGHLVNARSGLCLSSTERRSTLEPCAGASTWI